MGTEGESGKPSKVLKMLQLPVASVGTADDDCNSDSSLQFRIPSIICSQEQEVKHQSASGDSGGPWTLRDSSLNITVLAGVEVAGLASARWGSFSQLVNIAWFQDWIAHTILVTDPCLPDPAPARESFFYSYEERAPEEQFCAFEGCAACSDQAVQEPDDAAQMPGAKLLMAPIPQVPGCFSPVPTSAVPSLAPEPAAARSTERVPSL